MATDEGVQYETRIGPSIDVPPVHVVCYNPDCTFERLCDGSGYRDEVFAHLPVTAPQFQAIDTILCHQEDRLRVENRLHRMSMGEL